MPRGAVQRKIYRPCKEGKTVITPILGEAYCTCEYESEHTTSTTRPPNLDVVHSASNCRDLYKKGSRSGYLGLAASLAARKDSSGRLSFLGYLVRGLNNFVRPSATEVRGGCPPGRNGRGRRSRASPQKIIGAATRRRVDRWKGSFLKWLELRRLPPIMGFVWGQRARAGDPSLA